MHPDSVMTVLRDRAAGLHDDRRVALCVEGGTIRGVFSAAMLCALESCGIRPALFDGVYGTSAGALNSAYFVSGDAARGIGVYYDDIPTSGGIFQPRRILRRQPPLDLDGWITRTLMERRPVDIDDLVAHGHLRAVATDLERLEPLAQSPPRTADELLVALRASTRLPLLGGPPVEVSGRRLVDGSLSAGIPVQCAIDDGATDVLVLATRPNSVTDSSGPVFMAANAYLSLVRCGLLTAYRHDRRRRSDLRRRASGGMPFAIDDTRIEVVAPGAEAPKIPKFERSRDTITAAAEHGYEQILRRVGFRLTSPIRFGETLLADVEAV